MKEDQSNPDVYFGFAKAGFYSQAINYNMSLSAVETALVISPSTLRYSLLEAQILHKVGETVQAIRILKRLLNRPHISRKLRLRIEALLERMKEVESKSGSKEG